MSTYIGNYCEVKILNEAVISCAKMHLGYYKICHPCIIIKEIPNYKPIASLKINQFYSLNFISR